MKNSFFHSFGLKLLLVNLAAPLMLIGGMTMLGGYNEALEKAEFKNLETQAELIALSFNNYDTIIQGISKLPQLRAQIFSDAGQLLADTKKYSDDVTVSLNDLITTLTEGKIIRKIDNTSQIMSIIVPVYSVDSEIEGAVRVYASSREMKKKMEDLRQGLIKLSGIVFVITIALSMFLARYIARPLMDLADVAYQIKTREKDVDFPDFSKRKDEIGILSMAFKSMIKTINKKLDSFQSFASDVSHEIKNPLTSILSATQTVQKITDPEKKEKLLQIIFDDVERLNRLITDISSLSKISASVDSETLEKIAIIPLIENFSKVYQHNDDNQNIVINYDKSIANTMVLAKETRIAQVFNNLIGNAISFSDANSDITITFTKKAEKIAFAVADTGRGLIPGTEEKIFQRFYLDRSEDKSKHSGLGLSLSKTIVESFGGVIYASANTPKGAVFTVELPIFQER